MLRSLLSLVVLIGLGRSAAAIEPPAEDPSAAFFAHGAIPRLRIKVEPAQLEKLRGNNRSYVEATIEEEGQPPVGPVALKLKGAAGSFRSWEDRPALTVNMDKFRKKTTFHGLTKFYLNNSVQDESYLHELLAADLFHRAHLPAPRVTHARVWLNGRDVGLYVLKEGFDETFLARHFADPTGNLYDGGFLQDIDAALEKDEGAGVDDRSDLKALVAAAREADPARRRERMLALLDVDAFCGFMALEAMAGHWDGYSQKANNYRVYFDPKTGRATFLPHGMDQMFENAGSGIFDQSDRIVAGPILRTEDFRRRYRAQVARLVPLMDPPNVMLARVDEVAGRLQPVLKEINADRANHHQDMVNGLKSRLVARAVNLRQQLNQAEESSLDFDDQGVALLPRGWWFKADSGQGTVTENWEEPPVYLIRATDGQNCVISWRRRVLLDRGRYTLEVRAQTDGVEPLQGTENVGVGVGRGGTPRTQHRTGSGPWEPMTCTFAVTDDQTVELVLELRARKGTVAFDRSSLRLTRQPTDSPR